MRKGKAKLELASKLAIDPTKRVRPLVMGVSVGNAKITAGCLTKDTLIIGNPEVKQITEFKEGDQIFVLSDNGIERRRVRNVFDNGVRDVYLLRTQTGREIKATDNHPFLVARRVSNENYEKCKRAIELRNGAKDLRYKEERGKGPSLDKIAKLLGVDRRTIGNWVSGRHMPKPFRWGLQWISLSELKLGDYIVVLRERPFDGKPFKLPDIETTPRYKVIPKLPEETNDEIMWFFGYYLADGCVRRPKKNKKTYRVLIYEGDENKANKLVSLLKKYELNAKYYPNKRRAEIGSVYLVKLMEQVGLSGNAHTKNIPDWVTQLPKKQIEGFIRGFLFGDGYRHKSKTSEERYGVSSCNLELLERLRFLCQMVGWRTTRIHHRRRYSLIEGRRIEGDEYNFNIYLPVTKRSRRLRGGEKISYHLKIPEPFGLDRVVEIKYLGKENVYDLEIDGSEHNFIANNIVVHNSDGTYYEKDGEILEGSNFHVFGESVLKNVEDQVRDIVQPGPYHNGTMPDDYKGKLIWGHKLEGSPKSTCPLAGLYVDFGNALARLAGAKTRFTTIVSYEDNDIDFALATVEVPYAGRVLDQDLNGKKLAGHIFAGSDQATVFCRIENIMKRAKVEPAFGQEPYEAEEGDVLEGWSWRLDGYHGTTTVRTKYATLMVDYGEAYITMTNVSIGSPMALPGTSGTALFLKEG
jgi:intein/homing endonuclease